MLPGCSALRSVSKGCTAEVVGVVLLEFWKLSRTAFSFFCFCFLEDMLNIFVFTTYRKAVRLRGIGEREPTD